MTTSPLQTRTIANRATIDQAKGALVLRFRITPEDAFARLRTWASATDSSVLTVAQALVHGVCLGETPPRLNPAVVSYVAAAIGEPPPAPRHRARVPLPRLGVVR